MAIPENVFRKVPQFPIIFVYLYSFQLMFPCIKPVTPIRARYSEVNINIFMGYQEFSAVPARAMDLIFGRRSIIIVTLEMAN